MRIERLLLPPAPAGQVPHPGRPGSGSGGVPRRTGGLRALIRAGQVTIELLLVLPVFMLLLFFIMEMGNMGFQTILAHHCAYELARIGSLTAGPHGGNARAAASSGTANMKMKNALMKMFPNSPGVRVEGRLVDTVYDTQAYTSGQDLLVTLHYPARLIFPGSNYFLADSPKDRHIKRMVIKVRMPVEKPFFR